MLFYSEKIKGQKEREAYLLKLKKDNFLYELLLDWIPMKNFLKV